MPILSSDVAEIFEKVADLVEIEGENRFRIKGYWEAARTVGGYSHGDFGAKLTRCWRRKSCLSSWVWSGWATASTRSCGAGGTRKEEA